MVWWWYITMWLVVHMGGQSVTLLGTNDDAFAMMHGSYNGEAVFFVPFASSDMRMARLLDTAAKRIQDQPEYWSTSVDFSPALACALDKDALGDVYFLPNNPVPIFSSDPTQEDYTPLWLIHNVQWARGSIPSPLSTAADVKQELADEDLVETTEPAVLNASIVIDSEGNTIKQALDINMRVKKIWLPIIWTYHDNRLQLITLTETSDEALANQLGAWYCPRLANVATCSDTTYAFVNPQDGPAVSWMQLPVIDTAQVYNRDRNLQIDRSYTPLRCWTLLSHGEANPNSILRSTKTVEHWLKKDWIQVVSTDQPIVTNSPVVHPMRWLED